MITKKSRIFMTKRILFISLFTLLLTFAAGWEIAMTNKYNKLNKTTQAIPVIRFERFDESRNALIIGLFNPGTLPMEIDHAELFYQAANNKSSVTFNTPNYTDKVLVLDPGDTILVPLQKPSPAITQVKDGVYWGKLDFKIPGQTDFFSLHHRFSHTLHSAKNSIN
jgi:hypothetical protein